MTLMLEIVICSLVWPRSNNRARSSSSDGGASAINLTFRAACMRGDG